MQDLKVGDIVTVNGRLRKGEGIISKVEERLIENISMWQVNYWDNFIEVKLESGEIIWYNQSDVDRGIIKHKE